MYPERLFGRDRKRFLLGGRRNVLVAHPAAASLMRGPLVKTYDVRALLTSPSLLMGWVPDATAASPYSHRRCSLRLTKRWWPMIMWSTSSMSRMRPASTSCLVEVISSGEGVGSPLGWLWQRMSPGQLRMMAGRKTSAARRTELLAVPW